MGRPTPSESDQAWEAAPTHLRRQVHEPMTMSIRCPCLCVLNLGESNTPRTEQWRRSLDDLEVNAECLQR